MKSLFAGALMAAVCLAGAAQAADRVCSGEAEAESGASVEVRFTVDDKGTVKAREASWSVASPSGGLAALTGEPIVTVDYGSPTDQGLGAASRLGAFSMVMTDNGRYFAGATFALELPDGRKWTDQEPIAAVASGDQRVAMVMAIGELTPQTAADLFTDLELVGQAKVSFARGDAVLKGVVVDFLGRAERDTLFRDAWTKAMKAAEKPRRCKKAED